MNIVIFIALFIFFIAGKLIIRTLAVSGKAREIKMILIIGFIAIQPYILMWFVKYLFDYKLEYWISFGAILVLDLFTFDSSEVIKDKASWRA